MSLHTQLCDLLQIDYPVISAGMGFVVPVLTVLIGGIAGGLGGLTGAYLGQLAYPPEPTSANAESGTLRTS